MRRGFIKDIWDDSESYTYIADASSGALLKSQWGKLYTGTCYVNGKAYLFNSEGEMVKEL